MELEKSKNTSMLCDARLKDKVTCIIELNSVNRFANWQQACGASSECRYILVATVQEVQMLAVKRDPVYGQLVVSDTVLASLKQGQVNVMLECPKTGRVFYGREGGRVSELIFENTECERLNKSRVFRLSASVLG